MKKIAFYFAIAIFAISIVACNGEEVNNYKKHEINDTEIISVEVSNPEEDIVQITKEDVLDSIKEPYDIFDYFLLLPDSLVLDLSVVNRNNIPEIKDLQNAFESEIYYLTDTIDKKNAFLRIKSAGDGDGHNLEMTYFVKSDKTRLIAVNIIYWDMLTETSTLHFYTYIDNTWTDVTSEVIPEINMSSFSSAKTNVDNSAIIVALPLNGKTIKVKLDKWAVEEYAYDNDDYGNVLKKLYCTKYDLIWNDGTFSIANKILE